MNRSVIQQPTTGSPFVQSVGVDAARPFVHKQDEGVSVNVYMDILHSLYCAPVLGEVTGHY